MLSHAVGRARRIPALGENLSSSIEYPLPSLLGVVLFRLPTGAIPD